MYPKHFLHQSGYILGPYDFVFYYYFANIGEVFLIYLHWKHRLSYTLKYNECLTALLEVYFEVYVGVSPLWRRDVMNFAGCIIVLHDSTQ